jgi:hypothetical protein
MDTYSTLLVTREIHRDLEFKNQGVIIYLIRRAGVDAVIYTTVATTTITVTWGPGFGRIHPVTSVMPTFSDASQSVAAMTPCRRYPEAPLMKFDEQNR